MTSHAITALADQRRRLTHDRDRLMSKHERRAARIEQITAEITELAAGEQVLRQTIAAANAQRKPKEDGK